MGSITQIFRAYGQEFLDYHPHLPKQQKKVLTAIIQCRSGVYGAAVYRCGDCGKTHIVERSCGNRHCPQCQHLKARQWLAAQLARRLPGNHFLLTFTVPAQIRSFFLANQRLAYTAMFRAAAAAIKKLAADPRFIGTDLPGCTGILHTWGRQLQYHPHLHFIVPAGGMSRDRSRWLQSGNAFYLPVRALAKIFRAVFRAEMADSGLLASIDPAAWAVQWNVNCQPVGDAEASLKYLAPYVFRVAIADSRIVAISGRMVTFTYRKSGSNRLRTMTVEVMEFIRRFLLHALPPGFMKVRHYGFLSSGCKIPLLSVRLAVLVALERQVADLAALMPQPTEPEPPRSLCRLCGGRLDYLYSIIPGIHCRAPT